MITIFIDTHDVDIYIGLLKDGQVLATNIKKSLHNHSDFTVMLLDEILNNNHLTVHDLTDIIVVNGPGSFTGVRIGVTIAKTLAYTLNIPIRTISSLEMYAISYDTDKDKMAVIDDLKGSYAALYSAHNECLMEPFYMNREDFTNFLEKENYADLVIPENIIDLAKIYTYTRAKGILNPHQVNPLYVKLIEALK